MKNKIAKLSTLFCLLALVMAVAFALTACGGGTKYTYSSTNVEIVGEAGSAGGMDSTMKNMYDTMYKGSSITVSDKEIVWKLSDAESSMSVERDGDKYVLSGEYVDQMKQALSTGLSGASASVTFDMYGIETDGGFDIVMSASSTVNAGGTNVTVGSILTISFVK